MLPLYPENLSISTVDIDFASGLSDVFTVAAVGFTDTTLEMQIDSQSDESGLFGAGALITPSFVENFGGLDPFAYFGANPDGFGEFSAPVTASVAEVTQ
jgi:hypothetical protein